MARPAKELKGFARVSLHPREAQRVRVLLDSQAFSYFDTRAHQRQVDAGDFTVFISRSVNQVQPKGTISLAPSAVVAAKIKRNDVPGGPCAPISAG